MQGRLKDLISEANRRRVFRTTGMYLVGVWAISQGIVDIAPLFGAPEWILQGLLIGAICLTPLVVILSWMFDIGRTGITRDRKDVESAAREDELAIMETQVAPSSTRSLVAVEWSDTEGTHRIVFAEDFFIGRAHDCRVRFYDPLVSRKHVRVFLADGVWNMQDLGSRNGTIVDGGRIEAIELEFGSRGEVRVNERGPSLIVEVISPDDDSAAAELASTSTSTAASASDSTAAVAHIRNAPMKAPGPNRAVTMPLE